MRITRLRKDGGSIMLAPPGTLPVFLTGEPVASAGLRHRRQDQTGSISEMDSAMAMVSSW